MKPTKQLYKVYIEKRLHESISNIVALPNHDLLIYTYDLDGSGLTILCDKTLKTLHSNYIPNVDSCGLTLYAGYIGDLQIVGNKINYSLKRQDRYDRFETYTLREKTAPTIIYDPYWEEDFNLFKQSDQVHLALGIEKKSDLTNFCIVKIQPDIVALSDTHTLKIIDISEFRKTLPHYIDQSDAENKKLELDAINAEKLKILTKLSIFKEKVKEAEKCLDVLSNKEQSIGRDFYCKR